MSQLIKTKKLIIKFLTFPISPPGNDTIYAPNKAHRSDFVRMSALESMVSHSISYIIVFILNIHLYNLIYDII